MRSIRLASTPLFVAMVSWFAGCPDGGNGERPDADRGRLDAGDDAPLAERPDSPTVRPDAPGTPACGDVGERCCPELGTCSVGRRCEDDVCCAVPGGGVRCTSPDDCCGDSDCVGGACCVLQGSSCRSSAECCGDLLCEGGRCVLPMDDCGRDGGPCCAGGECRSGSVCVAGRCETCGGDGEVCCAPPSECAAGLTCRSGRCGAPDPSCGGAGQPCCAGDRCEGALACMAGTCAMPATECAYADCAECTRHYPCGWCADTGRCGVGTSSGPSSGSCMRWSWLASQCMGPTDPCADATTCEACTARPGCGFCDGACRSGTAMGPSEGRCTGRWSWLSLDCAPPADDCARHSDCAACTAQPRCGWCAATNTCSSGTSSGPSSGSCSSWSWLASSCPSTDACATHESCLDCTEQPSCGFCATTGTCATGTASGPSRGSCADWDYTPSQCMCAPLAAACTSDAMCCDELSCRRGATFGVRCCGERMASCRSGADCCGYMDCVSGRCACRAAGRGCLEDRDCCSGTCRSGRCG